MRLSNTNEEVVRSFADVLSVGTVYGPYAPYETGEHRRKPLWVWIAAENVGLDALALRWHWLSNRRRERARELTGICFPVFFRVASDLLAERFAAEA